MEKRIIDNWLGLLLISFIVSACGEVISEQEEVNTETPGINISYIDSTQNPTDDFFKFVNGNWLSSTEIPADQGGWGSFNELREYNNDVLLSVLKKATEENEYGLETDQGKAAAFYQIGMDSLLAEQTGLKPIKPYLDKVDNLSSKRELIDLMSEISAYGIRPFFGVNIRPDRKESNEMAVYVSQGGLGLPNRDYYVNDDPKSKEIKLKYVEYIKQMLMYIGLSDDDAIVESKYIMELESSLAKASMNNVDRRNPQKTYNKMSLEKLGSLTPHFGWKNFLNNSGIEKVETVIVGQPEFLRIVDQILTSTDLEILKNYFRYNIINSTADFLNHDLVKARFNFYSKELRGTEEMRDRWKRVLGTSNRFMGEAIGRLYVEQAFPPEAKEKAQEMVENIKLAFADRIKSLDWMTDSTKIEALKKLKSFSVKIGYPDQWKNYAGLEVETQPEKASYVDNVLNARKFNYEQQLAKLDKQVDKSEWFMSPQTVNAYYNPSFNEIVFPAGILQPPFYDYKADEAVNYGGIGAVIGHEISHGFDDNGSRYDGDGNLKNWWGDNDSIEFKARTKLLSEQFSAYEPLEDVFVDGDFTMGENIGDLGGINVAFDGLQRYYAEQGRPDKIDGFIAEQRFFMSWATIWRVKYRDKTLRNQVKTDPHSPGMYRANGPLVNMPEFYKAFNVKQGDGMYRPDSLRVKIW